ncbi:MAG TPA: PRC-barrel domain-containing protein [Candidatus Tectomicrobia bacterium]|nr:PRC-barrel domain-containing protein [Candidatus Tectomicrobia bacterium]
MKSLITTVTVSALSLTMIGGAVAQTTRPSTEQPPAQRRDSQGTMQRDDRQRQAWTPSADAVESSKIIGMKVKNSQGQDVGEIDQLIVDPSSGKVSHVVLGKGGVLGIGEQRLVLDWSDLKVQRDTENRNRWVAMVDQSKLDTAPRYTARDDKDRSPAASPTTTPGSGTGTRPGSR